MQFGYKENFVHEIYVRDLISKTECCQFINTITAARKKIFHYAYDYGTFLSISYLKLTHPLWIKYGEHFFARLKHCYEQLFYLVHF